MKPLPLWKFILWVMSCGLIRIPHDDAAEKRERTERIGVLLSEGIAAQDIEFDNLGDGESLYILESNPAINVVELAEYLQAQGVRI